MKISISAFMTVSLLAVSILLAEGAQPAAPNVPPKISLVLPQDRSAYFVGERVSLGLSGADDCKLEAINSDGRTVLYKGPAGALWLDTSKLAPGDYSLELNGTKVMERFTLTSPLRKSAGSMQDEVIPPDSMSADEAARILKESGLTACFTLGASDMGRAP